MDERELKKFEELELGFCGCGDPEGALSFLRDVLSIFELRILEGKSHWEEGTAQLWQKLALGHPEYGLLGLSYLYYLDSVGLLEHGTSIYGSWLSERGEEILQALREVDIETMMERPYDYQHEDLTSCPYCLRVTSRKHGDK